MANLDLFDMELDTDPKIINTPYILDNITNELEEIILNEIENDADDGLFSILKNIIVKYKKIMKK